jgi:AraC-like DNA-binding protein
MDKLTRVVDNLAMTQNRNAADPLPAPRAKLLETPVVGPGENFASRPEGFYRNFPVSERDRKWGFYVTTIGASRIAPHAPYPAITHTRTYHYTPSQTRVLQEFQIAYISRGTGALETQASGRVRIEAGSVYMLFPGIRHCEKPNPETGWNEHWIGFDGEVARRVVARQFFSPKTPIIKVRHEETILALFTDAVGAVKTNQPALQQILAGITLHILGLLYSDQHSQLSSDDHSMAVIHGAVNRMREHLESPIDLDQLAREFGQSYTSFRHKFAHHTGLSPHQYLLELRLARARTLLAETTLTTKEIAHQSGFEDEHYFCRFFHNKTGATPSEWRKRSGARSRGV